MSTSTPQYTTGTVTCADGTTIDYRRLGSGPGVTLLHAGVSASQHYMRLTAAALGDV
jgi:hypothetical protein